MRVLGIDVGLKRTGLALSDETGTAIRLLPNLLANSRAVALEKILLRVIDFNIEAIVIGCPSPNTTGSKAIFSRAMGLKTALEEICTARGLNTKIYVWDEAMTSKKAALQLVEAGIPKKKRSSMLDAASAAILVEEFLYAHADKS